MFEKELESKLKKIFGVKKVTYDQPSDTREQECLFLEVEVPNNSIKDGRALARVTGKATMFGSAEKLHFGFFSKAIRQASIDDTRPFFFSDIEANTKFYQNIVQRSFSFVYFFTTQYDPKIGTLTSVEITVTEET